MLDWCTKRSTIIYYIYIFIFVGARIHKIHYEICLFWDMPLTSPCYWWTEMYHTHTSHTSYHSLTNTSFIGARALRCRKIHSTASIYPLTHSIFEYNPVYVWNAQFIITQISEWFALQISIESSAFSAEPFEILMSSEIPRGMCL